MVVDGRLTTAKAKVLALPPPHTGRVGRGLIDLVVIRTMPNGVNTAQQKADK